MIKALIVYFKSTFTFEIYNQNELMNLKQNVQEMLVPFVRS